MSACSHISSVTCDNCNRVNAPYIHQPPQQPRIIKGLKCDVCGSTAIDHTEQQCKLNKMLNRPTPKDTPQ